MGRKASSPIVDVAVIGAGFSGLYALFKLKAAGFDARCFEAGSEIGGTWFWNKYPGARCDIQSIAYCYTFDRELHGAWEWSERYAPQQEILKYLNFVADKLNLRDLVSLNTTIDKAVFDEDSKSWTLHANGKRRVTAKHVVAATGVVSIGRTPDFPGVESFGGPMVHTGAWPAEGVAFEGKKVAVIGTGSSGVQVIPEIAKSASQLVVFQRTPAFVFPANNSGKDQGLAAEFRARFDEYRSLLQSGDVIGVGDIILSDDLKPAFPTAAGLSAAAIDEILEARWQVGGMLAVRAFNDLLTSDDTNQIVSEFVRNKIKAAVRDPDVADKLTPRDYPIGSKRPCVGTQYYETFNRDNVLLVDLREENIVSIEPAGVRTDVRLHEVDILVCATGFDALTGALARIDIQGKAGRTLRSEWNLGPRSYLGLAIEGFPNLFTVIGPGSPSVLSNVVVSIEQHIDWITDLLIFMRANKCDTVEADRAAQDAWTADLSNAAAQTLFMKGKSWYLGANVPGKAKVFMPYIKGVGTYRRICEDVAREGYRGFHFVKSDSASV